MLTSKVISGVFIVLALMTMTVSSQPIEAASSGAGVLSLLKIFGQIAIESFLEWAKKVFKDTHKCNKGNLELLQKLTQLTEEQCTDLGHLPNEACPSDHLSLAAKFLLTINKKERM